jgi:hypothetical protein
MLHSYKRKSDLRAILMDWVKWAETQVNQSHSASNYKVMIITLNGAKEAGLICLKSSVPVVALIYTLLSHTPVSKWLTGTKTLYNNEFRARPPVTNFYIKFEAL